MLDDCLKFGAPMIALVYVYPGDFKVSPRKIVAQRRDGLLFSRFGEMFKELHSGELGLRLERGAEIAKRWLAGFDGYEKRVPRRASCGKQVLQKMRANPALDSANKRVTNESSIPHAGLPLATVVWTPLTSGAERPPNCTFPQGTSSSRASPPSRRASARFISAWPKYPEHVEGFFFPLAPLRESSC